MWRTLITLLLCSAALAAGGPDKTVWDGVYTKDQAERGGNKFGGMCAGCHRGGFSGPQFMQRWREDKIGSFYDFIRKNMPLGGAGSGSQQDYLDITAWVLSSNNFPAGDVELTAATVGLVQVQAKEGPAPVPDGSLISVVACLAQNGDQSWTLTNASDAVRIREAQTPKDMDVKILESKALGTHTYRLKDPGFYHPEVHRGHKVEARGFLDREPQGDRLLLTAVETVSNQCAAQP
jgi:hypothetical protein